MARQFSINSESCKLDGGEIGCIELCGDVDQRSLTTIENVINDFYEKGVYRFIFDFADTSSINSSGLGLFINVTHYVADRGGGIQLIHVSGKIRTLFDLLGLGTRVTIRANKQEAMSFFRQSSKDM